MTEPVIHLDLPTSLKAALRASASTLASVEATFQEMQFNEQLGDALHPLWSGPLPSVSFRRETDT